MLEQFIFNFGAIFYLYEKLLVFHTYISEN